MYPNKVFVREKGDPYCSNNNRGIAYTFDTQLQGKEARLFYEDVLKTESKAVPKSRPPVKAIKPKRRIWKPDINEKDIFKFAESNNTVALSQLIENGVNVNVRDAFGWTPLMCATCSGAVDAVIVLLKAKADKSASDPGYNAAYLAKKHGHKEITKILNQSTITSNSCQSSRQSTISYCDLCKQNYRTSKSKHEASTSHLVEKNAKKVKTFYGLPDSNKGFQMLLRNGWNRESGLGPDGIGRKFPIKSTVKQDRTGIGCVKEKRVNNLDEFTSSQGVHNTQRSKDFERNFRLQFS